MANENTLEMKEVKKKSAMEYYERVKEYVDLSNVETRNELFVVLKEGGLLGKYRQYRQMNIVAEKLDLTMRGTPREYETHTTETYYRKHYKWVVNRDKKTSRFTKYKDR
jgi:hypothetical protein